MKTKIVRMTVNHGDYDYSNSETAEALTIPLAVASLLRTPMGVGYGPNDAVQRKRICDSLESHGKAEHGWANYSVVGKPVKPSGKASEESHINSINARAAIAKARGQ